MNPTSTPPDAALQARLVAQLDDAPEYAGGLSNHLPMALHALAVLGADAARLDAFTTRYAVRLGRRMPRAEAMRDDWPALRGDLAAFEELAAHFTAELRRRPPVEVLREALPLLWPGAAGGAFHGLIRTAHAWQAGVPDELALGLAYWAARWQTVPEVSHSGTSPAAPPSLAAWLAQLEHAAHGLELPGRLILERIRAATHTPAYAELAGALPARPEGDIAGVPRALIDLADWAASLYARSDNFTVLHVVTGSRAARVLLAAVGGAEAALPHLLRAVAAAVLSCHLRGDELPAVPADRGWDDVRRAAIRSDDEHVIKLVHAAWEESTLRAGGGAPARGPWLAAAWRATAAEPP